MFWGLIMEPNKRYSQVVESSFHLSMASLDVTGANDQPVQVMLCYDNRNYLLCTLKKGSIFQVPLDLNFQEGTKIAFTCNGFGHVHLTGYLIIEEELGLGDLDEEEEDEEVDEEEEEEIPQLVKPKKRNAVETLKKASKKLKKDESNDDEDSSLAETDSDEEDVTTNIEAEDDEDESDDDDEEEEDEDDSDDESEPEIEKSKQKQKQVQQAQNQLGKKQEKQKLVNGKDAKQELSKQKKKKPENEQQNSQQAKKRTIEGGVVVEDLVLGNGAPAKPGRGVTVYYVGKLKNGKTFDQTRQGDGFKFQLGKGEVIKGWDVGIAGMKIGGKRRLTIPAPMAYGNKGSPPVIPGNSTLIFEVELKKVH